MVIFGCNLKKMIDKNERKPACKKGRVPATVNFSETRVMISNIWCIKFTDILSYLKFVLPRGKCEGCSIFSPVRKWGR